MILFSNIRLLQILANIRLNFGIILQLSPSVPVLRWIQRYSRLVVCS